MGLVYFRLKDDRRESTIMKKFLIAFMLLVTFFVCCSSLAIYERSENSAEEDTSNLTYEMASSLSNDNDPLLRGPNIPRSRNREDWFDEEEKEY